MTIFTDLETSKKLAKYIKPKEGHRFYWVKGDKLYNIGMYLCIKIYSGAYGCFDYPLCFKENDLAYKFPAYTLEQLLEEIGEKVYSVGFVMTKEHILYIHFSAKLQDCKEFKSDSILQSAVDALIWVYEQKENKQ